MDSPDKAPILFDDDPLGYYWNRPVREIATLPPTPFSQAEAERHRIFSLALMSLTEHYWNGNKNGMVGPYRWRDMQGWKDRPQLWVSKPGGEKPTDYLGHNIGAFAVDGNGEIIDFEFNHNEVFDSSVEHAESRLVRRIFSLTQIGNRWNLTSSTPEPDYSTRLTNVTVYTSLESCAQCSGIMTLGRVKEVVYLQKDYGTFSVGNILYRLTHDPVKGGGKPVAAPKPIPACDFGLEHYVAIDAAYHEFFKRAKTEPFFNNKSTQSVAAFLCTDVAYQIYKDGAEKFGTLELKYPGYIPGNPDPDPNAKLQVALSNQQVLAEARRFVEYAIAYGNRGTGH